ncbi:MAG: hypothetical protein PHC53_05015 [Patescibacteria group bacterium]|nr:hypothetical protein [Patescibacteria group bacterium]
METRKIALACFIGGVLCSLVALLFAPAFWWFGLISGFVGGYLAYDFREVLRAIPKAARAVGEIIAEEWPDAKKWLVRPRPILYLAMSLAIVIGSIIPLLEWLVEARIQGIVVFISVISAAPFLVIISGASEILMEKGADAERCFWITTPEDVKTWANRRKYYSDMGYAEKPYTYANAYRWLVRGIGVVCLGVIRFLFWDMWRTVGEFLLQVLIYVGLALLGCVYYPCLFGYKLFKLIHSHKRVLCAFDSAIGGAMSYLLLARSAHTLGAQVALVLFGGLLGAGFGVLNWEVVSKRLLHVESKS